MMCCGDQVSTKPGGHADILSADLIFSFCSSRFCDAFKNYFISVMDFSGSATNKQLLRQLLLY